MFIASQCPDAQQIKNLLLGRLPSKLRENLEEHVLHCRHCAALLPTLKADDALVEAIRARAKVALHPADQDVVEGLMGRLRKLRPPVASAQDTTTGEHTKGDVEPMSDKPDSFDFLAPAQSAGEMGRLGKYRVLKLLGHGGMGMVFHAEDPGLQRAVALKVMLPSVAANAAAKERFLREARATAAIEHDHIVTIYQVDEDRGVAYLAMQFLKGASLEDYLKKAKETNKPMTLGQILKLGREIAKGLAAAHERGLIHRDIKPANVWLDATAGGRAKILDFGLARPAEADSSITQSGMIVGTPAYMAPEQATGQKIDGRADLFSLGVVLYRLCSGRLPWKGETAMATLMAVATEETTPLAELCPKLPPALPSLVMKLLAKNPADRPKSAKAVAEAIVAIEKQQAAVKVPVATLAPVADNQWQLNDESKTAPLVKKATPTKKRSRRWPLVAAAVLLLGGGVALWQVIIRIDNQDGSKTEIKTPPGATVTLEKDGKTVAQVGGAGQGANNAEPREVDLLKLIDPEKHAVKGKWRLENQQLVTPSELFDRLQIPVTPPLDYELEVVATRTEGKDALNLGLVCGKHQFILTLDGYFGKVSGLCYLDGLDVHRYDFWYRQRVFTNGQPCRISCKVRQQGISVTAEGKEIVNWKDYSRLSISPKWELPNKTQLGIGVGADTVYKIQRMVLRPLTTPAAIVDESWITSVRKMPPETQVEAVAAKLKELNPGFDGKVTHKIEGGAVTELVCVTDQVTDISPVRALAGLRVLHASGSAAGNGKLSDLSPLRGLQLTHLSCQRTQVADLSPLKGMPLIWLSCWSTPVADLTPLLDLKLKYLYCGDTRVTDLSALKGMPLVDLHCNPDAVERHAALLRSIKTLEKIHDKPAAEVLKQATAANPFDQWIKDTQKLPAEKQVEAVAKKLQELNPSFDGKLTPTYAEAVVAGLQVRTDHVSDLSPLRALLGLRRLYCTGPSDGGSRLTDLSPLRGINLRMLNISNTEVSDLTPLQGMKIDWFNCTGTPVKDLSPLRDMPLRFLYCDNLSERDREWLRSVKTLEKINNQPAAAFLKQATAANAAFEQWIKETQKLPPEKQVEAVAKKLQDLNPGFDGKVTHKMVNGQVYEFRFNTDAVSDLSPVRALLNLRHLECRGSHGGSGQPHGKVTSLAALEGMGLWCLACSGNPITDLSPLKSTQVNALVIGNTLVTDLKPLEGMPLVMLDCAMNDVRKVFDLAPVRKAPLKELYLVFKAEQHLEILKSIPTLEKINGKSAAEFLKAVDGKLP